MFDHRIMAEDKPTLYRDLASALQGLVTGEPDPIANMANAAALIFETLPDVNWAGFYRNIDGELVLGHGGRVLGAVLRAELAAQTRQTQLVEDVNAFPGHIACDSASNSEIVVPLVRDGKLIGVLDIDSPRTGRFDEDDRAGCERLGEILSRIL